MLIDFFFLHFYVFIFCQMAHFSISYLLLCILIRYLHSSRITMIITLVRNAIFFFFLVGITFIKIKWILQIVGTNVYPSVYFFYLFFLFSWYGATDSASFKLSPCPLHVRSFSFFFFLSFILYLVNSGLTLYTIESPMGEQ